MRGDFTPGKTVRVRFNTHKADGTPITLAGTPTVAAYKGSTTESTAGVTLTVDYDSRTGLHDVTVDTSADGTFYAAGSDYDLVLTAGTVDSISVVGTVVGSFSLSNRAALRPTTADRTLDVSAGGEAGIDWANIGSPTATVALSGTTVGTATALTNLPTIPANWITAAGIAASALNGKGDWLLSSGYTAPNNAGITTLLAGVNLTTILGNGTVVTGLDQMITDYGTGDFVVNSASSVGTVTGNVQGKVLGGGSGTITGTGVRAVDGSGNAIATASGLAAVAADVTPVRSGTAQGGSSTTIQLDAGASAVDDFYSHLYVQITSGTGAGQVQAITAYNGTSKTCTTTRWTTAPDGLSTFRIFGCSHADLTTWLGTAPNALSSGRVDSSTGAMAANVVNASALATDAVTEIQSGLATAAALTTVAEYLDTEIPTIQTAVVTTIPAAIDALPTAAEVLAAFVAAEIRGTVGAAATTTSIPTSALSPAAAVADQFVGRVLLFDHDTATAALRGQATEITASTSGGVLTVTALTTAPASGDTFTIA